jgi:CYTH domain-containing protein
MPVENERKFVLHDPHGALEQALATARPAILRTAIRQAYLDTAGLRIRRFDRGGQISHIFSYKRPVDGVMVEIEREIDALDFERLWKLRRETLEKVRYSIPAGDCMWDIDFFKDAGRTYFALAEVEMPEDREEPPPPPAILEPYVEFLVARGDERFSSKKLADPAYARRLELTLGPSSPVAAAD